jgi:hypothetical protein
MANAERSRMLELGQWLQDYLAPDTNTEAYRKLAKDFLRIYNVDFDLSANEISLKIFELMEKSKSQHDQRDFIQCIDDMQEDVSRVMGKPQQYQSFNFQTLYDKYPSERKAILDALKAVIFKRALTTLNELELANFDYFLLYDWTSYCLHTVSRSIRLKELLVSTFDGILNCGTAWDWYFEKKAINDEYFSKTYSNRMLQKGYDYGYNCLADEIKIQPGKIKKITVFRTKFSMSSQQKYMGSSIFPWEAAASKMFFDFLFLGGQDHFKFCDYCGAFTVIRRKDSKKFCSNLCRAQFRHSEIAKSQ